MSMTTSNNLMPPSAMSRQMAIKQMRDKGVDFDHYFEQELEFEKQMFAQDLAQVKQSLKDRANQITSHVNDFSQQVNQLSFQGPLKERMENLTQVLLEFQNSQEAMSLTIDEQQALLEKRSHESIQLQQMMQKYNDRLNSAPSKIPEEEHLLMFGNSVSKQMAS